MQIIKKKSYSELEVIQGLQRHDGRVEEWFYAACKRYVMEKFDAVFFDKDLRQEIFHDSFLRLWTEIENGKITIVEDTVQRQQKDGNYAVLSCSLTTFLMAIAKNNYREVLRNHKEVLCEEIYDDASNADEMQHSWDSDEDEDTMKNRIVDECIQSMSPRCVEILTLFYYENKSLDEILEIREDKNTSKDGLKTSKYKCMTTLRTRIEEQFAKFHLTA